MISKRQNGEVLVTRNKHNISSAIAERPWCRVFRVVQGGSVSAKSERRYSADIIGLSSTTVT